MYWYKIAQNKWEDFQWNEPGFKYKQCYNCGRFFLPDKTFAYPPKTNYSKNMDDVLLSIDPQEKERHQINKNTITHGICPKCFVEQMQKNFGLSYEEALNELPDEYLHDFKNAYYN
jgi:RNA polymerase subunit RPABC4/transcription elongation factor Spt4